DVQVRGLGVVVAAEDRVRRVGELVLGADADRPAVDRAADEQVVSVGVGGAGVQAQLRRGVEGGVGGHVPDVGVVQVAVRSHARQGGAVQVLLTFQAEGGHGAAQGFRSAVEAAEAHVFDLLRQVHGAGQGGFVASVLDVRVGGFSIEGDGP